MTPQYIASLIAGIVPALEPLVTVIENASKTPAAMATKITTALQELETLATSLSSAPDVSATAPILSQIQAYSQEILTAAAGLGLPFPESLYLQLGSMVVMGALTAVQTILAAQTPPVSMHMTVKCA